MYALTVKQPWAQAIAHFGKDVENRSRQPPAHLLGQRVAIHVSQARDHWDNAFADSFSPRHIPAHLLPLFDWVGKTGVPLDAKTPPAAGRIIATALLVGGVKPFPTLDSPGNAYVSVPQREDGSLIGFFSAWCGMDSPWFLPGKIGWVLDDVRPLRQPVGEPCPWCDGGSRPGCLRCSGGVIAIRGQVYPFALSPEVEAAVKAQEAA